MDKIIKISVTSIPEETSWYDEHWAKWYDEHKHLNDNDYYKAKQKLKNRMKKELKLVTEFNTLAEFKEYANGRDWCNMEKYVDINIERGNKQQYASYIPHIQITVDAPLTIVEEEKIL